MTYIFALTDVEITITGLLDSFQLNLFKRFHDFMFLERFIFVYFIKINFYECLTESILLKRGENIYIYYEACSRLLLDSQ